MQKTGYYLQGQGHSNWVWVHTMKSWPFLSYVLNCWFFGNQLSLTVHVHKLVHRSLCCIQGQAHSEGSELQWMFAWTIFLILKLARWCIIISQSIIQKYLLPQSFLLDLQKYLNFCFCNEYTCLLSFWSVVQEYDSYIFLCFWWCLHIMWDRLLIKCNWLLILES